MNKVATTDALLATGKELEATLELVEYVDDPMLLHCDVIPFTTE